MSDKVNICVVEDDTAVREALVRLLDAAGHRVAGFASAEDYEDKRKGACGCMLLDVRLPGVSGLVLQERLRQRDEDVPIVFLTGHGDVPLAVKAMKNGAVDFLIKPVDEEVLLSAVERALDRHRSDRDRHLEIEFNRERVAQLTPRELDVLQEIVTGAPNKQIAVKLDIAIPTVKIHRGRVMAKMEAGSVVELARKAALAGVLPAAAEPS